MTEKPLSDDEIKYIRYMIVRDKMREANDYAYYTLETDQTGIE